MIKRLFCLNITDKNNMIQDESMLITERVNPTLLNELEQFAEQIQDLESKSRIPKLLLFVKYLFIFAWIMPIAGIFMDYADGMSFDEIYQESPLSYFIAPLSFLIFMAIQLYERRIKQKVEDSDHFQYIEAKMRKAEEDAFRALGVPDNAIVMDVLGYRYKEKENQFKIVKISGLFEYWNMVKRVYIKEDELYFAALDVIVSIPISSIKSITPMNKKVTIPSWNKDVPFNKGIYEQYKIKRNSIGVLIFKTYYTVNVEIGSSQYELYIPNYDIQEFLSLVKVEADKGSKTAS